MRGFVEKHRFQSVGRVGFSGVGGSASATVRQVSMSRMVELRLRSGMTVQIDRLGDAADEWYGEGPGGAAIGDLGTVLNFAVGGGLDPEWLAITKQALELEAGSERVGLVVQRGEGVMFHATRAINRASIARHGLNWLCMATRGIAGSEVPEYPGVFLCSSLEDARWFAAMAGEPTDIWQVAVDGLWLISDPSASGGADDAWSISTESVAPARLNIAERDLQPRG